MRRTIIRRIANLASPDKVLYYVIVHASLTLGCSGIHTGATCAGAVSSSIYTLVNAFLSICCAADTF